MPSTAQPAPETDEKKSRGLGSYVLWAFVAVMVYVLSSGPMFRIATTGEPVFRSPAWANFYTITYWPLIKAWDNSTAAHKPLGIYWHFWVPRMFNANGDMPRGLRGDYRR